MQIIGHRGAAGIAPENTWSSFDAAIASGVDAIETDVRATSDDRLILIHDKFLDRTTNGKGRVRRTPWSVVKELDAGSWFDSRFRTARVPSLRETLVRYAKTTPFVLEIKKRGIELAVLEIAQELCVIDQITFTSFHFDVLLRIKREDPPVRTGFLSVDTSDANVQRAADAGFSQFCPPAQEITEERVHDWKRLGLEVRAWAVTDRNMAIRARNAGVDGITVKVPDWGRAMGQ